MTSRRISISSVEEEAKRERRGREHCVYAGRGFEYSIVFTGEGFEYDIAKRVAVRNLIVDVKFYTQKSERFGDVADEHHSHEASHS